MTTVTIKDAIEREFRNSDDPQLWRIERETALNKPIVHGGQLQPSIIWKIAAASRLCSVL